MKYTSSIRTIAALAVLAAVNTASAQTATQTVTFQVNAINQIAVTGTPSLTITAAAAGSAPTSVTSTGNTWSVTTNQSTASITASIPTVMPAGLTLSANLTAPAGATSTGLTALGVTAVNVVTGITKLNSAGLALSYQLDATAAAGVVASATRVVTYTITGGV
jgi:hypothetical protein